MNINKEAKIEERVVLGDLCNYSEEEKYIGIWIDGKPIYRKVMVITGKLAYNVAYDVGVFPDTVIKMSCLVKQNEKDSWRSLPWLFTTSDTIANPEWAGGFYYYNGAIKFQLGTVLRDVEKTVFIMEYTKTTN